MTKPSKEEVQRRLRECRSQYARIKSHMDQVGFICEGSLAVRWIQCGKPNCGCLEDPKKRHGPYYQLSWKESGKTVSRRLTAEHALLYEEWIANRRLLQSILEEMQDVSRKAGRYVLADFAGPSKQDRKAKPKPRASRRKVT